MPSTEGRPGTPGAASFDSYHLLLDSAPYGVYRSSLDGRFQEVNAALVQLLGYATAEELLAVDLAEELYGHASDRDRLVRDAMARYQGDPERPAWSSAEVSWRRKDGTALIVRLSGTPVRDPEGKLVGFQMMVEDRTEQRQLEQQLRQMQKMEAVGRLTSGIAHDFNNLLAVILGNAHLLTEGVSAGRPDLVEDLEDLRRAAERGVDLVKKLSAFGRNEPLTLRPLDLRAVVHDTMRLLQRTLPSTIALRTSLGEAPLRIAGDPSAIEQLLLNLANNARDAMPDGGSLEIELRPRRLTAEDRVLHPWVEQGDFVCLTVTDNGVGMGPEARQRIFEPFFTTKARGEGTGLGMAMVYGLVKQHAGYIHLYSEPGLGTALRLFFPLSREEHPIADEGSRAPAALPGGNETVLIVEDEPHLLATARRLLTGRGYQVIGASDAVAALDILRARRKEIDLVLSDMVMPRMGGRQLHDILRAEGDLIPVLLTSGYTEATLITGTGERAPIPFLQKPWTAAEFLGLVRQVLDGTWVAPEG
jgi:two-component system cell cycle sensor histidine kinase/response regulator CckA